MLPNRNQSEAWNGGESVHYVDHADRYDRQLAPFTEALLEQVRLTPHRSLLDVGCGCGALTIAASEYRHSAVGVDISVPLTEVAFLGGPKQRRSTTSSSSSATPRRGPFASGTFDLVVSQFGLGSSTTR